MATDKPTLGVVVEPEEKVKIKQEADREMRSVSSLMRSIVIREIERREQQREQPDNANLATA